MPIALQKLTCVSESIHKLNSAADTSCCGDIRGHPYRLWFCFGSCFPRRQNSALFRPPAASFRVGRMCSGHVPRSCGRRNFIRKLLGNFPVRLFGNRRVSEAVKSKLEKGQPLPPSGHRLRFPHRSGLVHEPAKLKIQFSKANKFKVESDHGKAVRKGCERIQHSKLLLSLRRLWTMFGEPSL
jgi:hypothetical protein